MVALMSPDPNSHRRLALVGFALGVPLTALALLFAIASAGAGHGDYLAARLLFPVPMLASLLTEDTIKVPSIVAALLQFPAYGALIGWSWARHVRYLPLLVATVHIMAAIMCFAGLLPNFS